MRPGIRFGRFSTRGFVKTARAVGSRGPAEKIFEGPPQMIWCDYLGGRPITTRERLSRTATVCPATISYARRRCRAAWLVRCRGWPRRGRGARVAHHRSAITCTLPPLTREKMPCVTAVVIGKSRAIDSAIPAPRSPEAGAAMRPSQFSVACANWGCRLAAVHSAHEQRAQQRHAERLAGNQLTRASQNQGSSGNLCRSTHGSKLKSSARPYSPPQ